MNSTDNDVRALTPRTFKLRGNQCEKDDRVVVLLGIGVLFLLISCLQNAAPFFQNVQQRGALHWNGTALLFLKSDLQLHAAQDDSISFDSAIPAALSPLFFIPIPINEADQELLETIPGIGPKLAKEIIATRTLRGPYQNAEDLLHISGIGQKRMQKFADYFSFR